MTYSQNLIGMAPNIYWRLDDTGSTAADSSGNARNGTIQASVTKSQAGLIAGDANTCMSFPGTSSARVTSSYQPWSSGMALTIAAIYTCTNSGTFNVICGGDTNVACELYCNTHFWSWDNDFSTPITWDTTTDVQTLGTTHIVMTATNINTAANFRLWINGSNLGAPGGGPLGGVGSVGNFTVGDSFNSTNAPWNGKIDEIALWSRVLSDNEIMQLYRASTQAFVIDPTMAPIIQT